MGARAFDILHAAGEIVFSCFNLLEGFFWLAVAAGLSFAARRGRGSPGDRRSAVAAHLAAGFFALFGISDFIEISTGAWWRPWWLLGWKALCIGGLAVLYVRHVRAGGYWGLIRIKLSRRERGD